MFLYDRTTRKTALVSAARGTAATPANGSSGAPIVSSGGYVFFASGASNLVEGDFNGFYDLFLYSPQP